MTLIRTTALALALLLLLAPGARAWHLADRHAKAGVACASCHGPDAKNPEEPTIETCIACHPLKPLVASTASVKPKNPHVSPHYQDRLDCTNCHSGHDESQNFCAQCHNFDFKVP